MKKTLQKTTITVTVLLFSIMYINAQTHKSYLAKNNEGLPMNRAAFIFCYNNGTSYKNPAASVITNKTNHTSTVAADQNRPTASVSIFPNTTEDELWVELNSEITEQDNLNIEIYNASGQQIYTSRIEEKLHKINVCDFTAGTFLVKTGDIVKKLVIE